jgi:hypothetical protein
VGSVLADRHDEVAGALAGLAIAGVLVAASALTLGPPNLPTAGGFLSGSYPSMASAVAFVSLLCYTVVLGVVGLAVIRGLLMVKQGRSVGRTARAATLLVVGLVLLSLSVVNRVDSGDGICCGGGAQQVREAVSLAR